MYVYICTYVPTINIVTGVEQRLQVANSAILSPSANVQVEQNMKIPVEVEAGKNKLLIWLFMHLYLKEWSIKYVKWYFLRLH